ncbi:MAG TPA: thioredoxin family protein [Casimicrobiaceae bacterium]|nr:thioredoxin family protein [Casimicrobiaceae bacterium]
MAAFSTSSAAPAPLARQEGHEPPLVVVALCAAWCNTCAEFRPVFDAIAAARPAMTFVWLDIEDDAEICGDLDVESFPTVLAFRGRRALHFGVTLPIAAVAARLIDELARRDQPSAGIPDAAIALCNALAAARSER